MTEVRAFVEGRQILDVVIVANEVVDERHFREKGVVFKIDFEKAYDNLKYGLFGSCIREERF